MAERLGGDAVDVLFPVPEGRAPSFWRPGLSDIAAIQKADLIALNGAGFATWTTRMSLPCSRIVDTCAGFSDAFISMQSVTHSHGADGEHSHTGTANDRWLDFAQAMQRRMPDLSDRVAKALPSLVGELTALDTEARDARAALQGSMILATYPRYQYFTRAYGLEIAALEWEAGAMPDDGQWQDLKDMSPGALPMATSSRSCAHNSRQSPETDELSGSQRIRSTRKLCLNTGSYDPLRPFTSRLLNGRSWPKTIIFQFIERSSISTPFQRHVKV
jgi:ABC-type Zn2+ transport system substrate-binding protein/surface adhesin